MAQHNEFGKWGEQVAEEYLRKKGYSILERDWHYDHKDLDVVAYLDDSDTLVSVEVKTRKDEEVTKAIQAVTVQKEKNLIHATYAFARSTGHYFKNIRFDIITIVGTRENYELQHYEDIIHPGRRGGRRLI